MRSKPRGPVKAMQFDPDGNLVFPAADFMCLQLFPIVRGTEVDPETLRLMGLSPEDIERVKDLVAAEVASANTRARNGMRVVSRDGATTVWRIPGNPTAVQDQARFNEEIKGCGGPVKDLLARKLIQAGDLSMKCFLNAEALVRVTHDGQENHYEIQWITPDKLDQPENQNAGFDELAERHIGIYQYPEKELPSHLRHLFGEK